MKLVRIGDRLLLMMMLPFFGFELFDACFFALLSLLFFLFARTDNSLKGICAFM